LPAEPEEEIAVVVGRIPVTVSVTAKEVLAASAVVGRNSAK
jgi:hypothetical protein